MQRQLMSPVINPLDCLNKKRGQSADNYCQCPVPTQNTSIENHRNSFRGIGHTEKKARKNSQIAYGKRADVGNAYGEVRSRMRYIKIRNDEDNYYNDKNNNYNDNGSSSNIRIGKLKQENKRT